MTDLSAPKSTTMSQTDMAQDKLKGLQKAKIDEDRFIQELFLFFQKMLASILKGLVDPKAELTDLAKDCGYQDLPTALNSAKNSSGQSPLTQALQGQDFSLAQTLLNSGAKYDVQSMDEYDLAIHSQRGQQALQQKTITPPEDYAASRPDKLHVVKEFGLVLGIVMQSVDNTSSQRAHVGPTYQLMTDAVKGYNQECTKQPAKKDFAQIADAFDFANKKADFQFSTPEGSPEAGKALSDRVQAGKVTSVPINCKGHAMGLSFVPVEGNPDKVYLVFTNRGEGAKGKYGTQIYEVDKKDVNADFINGVMSGHDKGLSHGQVMEKIHQVTKGQPPISTIEQRAQKVDNCTIANTRSNIHGVLLCQEANRRGGFANVTQEVRDDVKGRYKEFTSDMKDKCVQKLEKLIKSDPGNIDLKGLAKGFMDKPNHKHSDILQAAVSDHQEPVAMRSM